MFKTGEQIKLKSYVEFSDYKTHKNQICKLRYMSESADAWTVEWSDSSESYVDEGNMLKLDREWDDENNV